MLRGGTSVMVNDVPRKEIVKTTAPNQTDKWTRVVELKTFLKFLGTSAADISAKYRDIRDCTDRRRRTSTVRTKPHLFYYSGHVTGRVAAVILGRPFHVLLSSYSHRIARFLEELLFESTLTMLDPILDTSSSGLRNSDEWHSQRHCSVPTSLE